MNGHLLAWKLTGKSRAALQTLAVCGTWEEAAARYGTTQAAFRRTIDAIARGRGLTNTRTLMHRALQDRQLPRPPVARPAITLVLADLAVWRHLVLDVPDTALEEAVALMTGLPRGFVREALVRLRAAEDEPGWRTVMRGWRRGVLTTRSSVVVLDRGGMGPRSRHRPAPRGLPVDRLRLVPDARAWRGRADAAVGDGPAPGSVVVTGVDCGLLRVAPALCRQLLERTPADQWGPVIGHPDGNAALLVTAPRAMAAGWRAGEGARMWRAGARLALPPQHPARPGSMYWAVSCQAPPWRATGLRTLEGAR
ncbi:hypothetical protein ACFVWY_32880 [Streptomyces sp. NPDC058195]|uniref:hypothetical protein n=1 Tax=Streptomyces sp. NPDC058195 TaxID=3346375 RepID=UPI0036EA15F9